MVPLLALKVTATGAGVVTGLGVGWDVGAGVTGVVDGLTVGDGLGDTGAEGPLNGIPFATPFGKSLPVKHIA